MNAQARTSKGADQYCGECAWLREPGGLGSNPYPANTWLGCWPSLALCIFLLT